MAASNEKLISTVGVWAGSGSELANHPADLYLTGELGHYYDVLEELEQNRTVILCEHSNTERGYLSAVLKPKLEALQRPRWRRACRDCCQQDG
jgi:putative NIF3 family GTP cyclohydrolase 1 type 2